MLYITIIDASLHVSKSRGTIGNIGNTLHYTPSWSSKKKKELHLERKSVLKFVYYLFNFREKGLTIIEIPLLCIHTSGEQVT